LQEFAKTLHIAVQCRYLDSCSECVVLFRVQGVPISDGKILVGLRNPALRNQLLNQLSQWHTEVAQRR
jgi:hypothetical protein